MGWGLKCNHKHHFCSNRGLRRLHPAIQKHFTISLLPWSFHALDLRIDLHYTYSHCKHFISIIAHWAYKLHHAYASCTNTLHCTLHIARTHHITLHIAPPQHEARAHLTCICLHTPIRHSSLYAIVATRNILPEKPRSAVGKVSWGTRRFRRNSYHHS